jgi:hypothetical protein
MQQTSERLMESNEERYRRAAEASEPPRPKAARPIVILGAGGIVRAAHLPAYAKAGFLLSLSRIVQAEKLLSWLQRKALLIVLTRSKKRCVLRRLTPSSTSRFPPRRS